VQKLRIQKGSGRMTRDETLTILEDTITELQQAAMSLPVNGDPTPGCEDWQQMQEAQELVREVVRALLELEKLWQGGKEE